MREVHGNLSGIRDSSFLSLASYDYPVGSDEFPPPDLARLLASFSARSTGRSRSTLPLRRRADISVGYLDNVALEELRCAQQ